MTSTLISQISDLSDQALAVLKDGQAAALSGVERLATLAAPIRSSIPVPAALEDRDLGIDPKQWVEFGFGLATKVVESQKTFVTGVLSRVLPADEA